MSVLAAGRLVHALAHRACAQPLLLAQQHAAFASLHMGLHPTHSSLLAGAPAGAVQQQPQQLLNVSELGFRCGFNEEYRMGEALGTGSFGQVRVAIHRQSSSKAAVKIMSKVRGKLSRAKTLEKIAREISFVQQLQSCDKVVRLLGCYEDADVVQMVTELCTAGDLRRYVESYGALDEAALAVVAVQVLHFLKCCHDQRVVYGDVKPANFCLNKAAEGDSRACSRPILTQLKTVDFGSAQQLPGEGRLSSLIGTFAFLAPECYAQDYGLKADMWSLGVMLYWLFTLRYPFWESGDIPAVARLEDMAAAAQHEPIRYDVRPFAIMSPQGLEFMQRLLCRDEQERMGVHEALTHPWLAAAIANLTSKEGAHEVPCSNLDEK